MTTSAAMEIQFFRGIYRVNFHQQVSSAVADVPRDAPYHCIVDDRVVGLYGAALEELLSKAASVIPVVATENNKSLEQIPSLIQNLSEKGIKRDHLLVAVGGGITQDMTCFAASILFRGMDWMFLPTTLLAQADSCIGSKSSINAGDTKNLVGTFYAPKLISIATDFLTTLDPADVRSGVGEMLKVHAIDGPPSFDRLAKDYAKLFSDSATMLTYVRGSLEIKKKMVELDEFDRGPRNVMNYGHSFGHAIEAATEFGIPHGIAVTMGADMANFVSSRLGRSTEAHFVRMHDVLRQNYRGYENIAIPLQSVLAALGRDKKNVGKDLVVILPDQDGVIEKVALKPSEEFQESCRIFLDDIRLGD